MGEAKHTAGPWDWEATSDGKRIGIGIGLVDGPNGYDVAEVYSDDCDQDEALANARLIAAAPDMLKALQSAVDVQGVCPDDESCIPCRAMCAAIAKATGQ